MDRRTFLRTAAATAAITTIPSKVSGAAPTTTRWIVRGSEGFDALSFLSPLSGDPFYLRYYEKEVAAFAPQMPADAMATLKALKARSERANILLSPFLDLRFSGGEDATLDDIIQSAADPDRKILPRFQSSPYWEGEQSGWAEFKSALPALVTVLTALRDAGFPAFRRGIFDAKAQRIEALKTRFATFDPIEGAQYYTGRTFDPTIEIILLQFCKPHGIKVIGQRFLSAVDWPDEAHMRTAGHEILHPPLDKNGAAFAAALKVLEHDPLIARIIKEHDPKFGYNSLDGLLDEDLVSAIDQLIAERFAVARDARDRWTKVDDGMHILSAGLYGLMKQDGFARTGGNLETWLLKQATGGRLAPSALHPAAAQVLGRPVDRLWPLPGPAKP